MGKDPVWGNVVTQRENGVGGGNNPPDRNSGGLFSREELVDGQSGQCVVDGFSLDEAGGDEE